MGERKKSGWGGEDHTNKNLFTVPNTKLQLQRVGTQTGRKELFLELYLLFLTPKMLFQQDLGLPISMLFGSQFKCRFIRSFIQRTG